MAATHGSTGPQGTDVAFFQDNGSLFLLTVDDPLLYQTPYDTLRTTDSVTFPGVSSIGLFSGAGAIVEGFNGGSGFIGDYTVTLSTAAATSAVPEPANPAVVGLGLALLILGGRRLRTRAV